MSISAELKYQARFGLPIWFASLCTSFFPDNGVACRVRGQLISFILPGRPKRLAIGRDVTLLCVSRMTIGDDVYIAKGGWLNGLGGISILSEVVMGPYVVMSSNNHGFVNGSVFGGGAHPARIVIGKGSWLAAHAVVTAGVSVGSGVVVGANSVVTRDTTSNVIVAGVPAKVVAQRLDNPSSINSKFDSNES